MKYYSYGKIIQVKLAEPFYVRYNILVGAGVAHSV
jgi:hypothetical protein